jgi:2-polyprenyl-6-methoxyphenol hydroxylase-like FAD-dependent oxidoreductase
MRVAITGYGTAGQAAAIFLARAGHDVEIFERSPELRPVGAGFLLQPTGFAVLAALGLAEAALALGARIERLDGCNARGRHVMDMRYADHDAASFGLGMTRSALFSLLHGVASACATIRTNVRIVAFGDDGRHLVDDGGAAFGPYDLVVAADGANSALRTASGLVRREPVYPWGAMWCLIPADEWPHANELRQRYDGTRTMFGVLPVGARAGADGRWLTFYYSLRGARVDAFDADALATMQHDVAALWPELAERTHAITDATTLHRARYRDVVLRAPWQGRIVFIGDAAHAMSPQLGQGANMALLDAAALGAAFDGVDADDVASALARYAHERASHVGVYQHLSRWLTPLFQSDGRALGRLRDAVFGPFGRLPIARREMLKILTGTKRGWFR